jgi:hypothetical protein
VSRPRTISTASLRGGGVKKWVPQTRSGRPVAAASSVMEMEEVLVRMRASGGSSASRAARVSFLGSTRSTTASMTASASLISVGFTVQWMRS